MTQGHANLIMDNLIAEGKIKPFIVVCTYGMTNNIQFGGLGSFTAQDFEKVLCDELVPFIDANRVTHDLEQGMGIEGSRRLHMWFRPGEHPSVPKGRKDNTHYNVYGATVVAGLLAEEIAHQVPALKKKMDIKKIKKLKKRLK